MRAAAESHHAGAQGAPAPPGATVRKSTAKAAIVRPDNYKCRKAECHTEAAAALARGQEPPWTGIQGLPIEGHLRAALALRASILEDIKDNAGMDPELVACRGNVALAEINLARHLHAQGRLGGAEGATAHYAAAAAILEEAVPLAPLTVENAVVLAGLQGGGHDRAFRLLADLEAHTSEALAGALAAGSGAAAGADLVRRLQADLAAARAWQEGLLKDWGLALLEAQPWDEQAFEGVCARLRALLAAAAGSGAAGSLGLAHALAGLLLARPSGPSSAGLQEAERVYAAALEAPGAQAHADFCDASFNLGVILHFKALEGGGEGGGVE